MVVAVAEESRSADRARPIVRLPETACSTDHFRRMDMKTRTISSEDQAELLAARQAYMEGVRAWVTTGKHALTADAARANLSKVTLRDKPCYPPPRF